VCILHIISWAAQISSAVADTAQPKPSASTSASSSNDAAVAPNAAISALPQSEQKYQDPEYLHKEFKRGRMAFLFGEYDTAGKILLPLAEHNYAMAQSVIGWMYHTGKGRSKDLHQAYAWYQKAAKLNDPIAQNNLGVFFEQGLGVDRNYQEAAKWYRESAEWGYRFAQYNLGLLYHEGHGVAKDPKQAQYWLQLAALQGVKQAIEKLKSISRAVHGNRSPNDSAQNPASPIWERQLDKETVKHNNPHSYGGNYHNSLANPKPANPDQ